MYGFLPPPPPRPGPSDREPSERSGPEERATAKPSAPQLWNLRLDCAGTNLPARFLDESEAAVELAVEDLCWEAAVEDWKQRRPPRWHLRSRAAWAAEGAWLAAQAEHLRKWVSDVLQEL